MHCILVHFWFALDIDNFPKYIQDITYSKDNKKLTENTINNILNLFKTIIKYGVKNDFIKNDVSKYVKLFSIDNARERFLSKRNKYFI
ncbi:phage integrase SAM-like domain-containing protein [Halarcobacter mediterraneus]|uniref:phage integrase SAM-like domain-containing protein n=1 Tax=Halarcobacter mediterraneus TaxID=2023153 RepID=UPI0013E93DD5|nr:phage integrase SAM-like domain-containing protein [Halarcobacter mediterraneus]